MNPIGIRLHPSYSAAEQYTEAAKKADSAGFSELWIPEDQFFRDSVSLAAVVGHVTNSIDVGIFLNSYTRHPVLSAMTMASLDNIVGGELKVSIGPGPRGVMEQFIDYEEPVRTTKEAIDVIRATLIEEPQTYDGTVFRIDEVRLGGVSRAEYLEEYRYPRNSIPIYVAGVGPVMLRMAGEIANGVMTSNGFSAVKVEEAISRTAIGRQRRNDTLEAFRSVGLVACVTGFGRPARLFAARWLRFHDDENLKTMGLDPERVEQVKVAYEEDPTTAAEFVTRKMAEKVIVLMENAGDAKGRIEEYRAAGLDVPILAPLRPSDIDRAIEIGSMTSDGD